MDDITERRITKIAREAEKFTVSLIKTEGVGTAELDFIHAVRHNPGITQAGVRRLLNIDKGAAARRVASLEAKGLLVRRSDCPDGRCSLLYATEKAEGLKNTKASIETLFYSWLCDELEPNERSVFAGILERLYRRSKAESRGGFRTLEALMEHKGTETGGSGAEVIMEEKTACVTGSREHCAEASKEETEKAGEGGGMK